MTFTLFSQWFWQIIFRLMIPFYCVCPIINSTSTNLPKAHNFCGRSKRLPVLTVSWRLYPKKYASALSASFYFVLLKTQLTWYQFIWFPKLSLIFNLFWRFLFWLPLLHTFCVHHMCAFLDLFVNIFCFYFYCFFYGFFFCSFEFLAVYNYWTTYIHTY